MRVLKYEGPFEAVDLELPDGVVVVERGETVEVADQDVADNLARQSDWQPQGWEPEPDPDLEPDPEPDVVDVPRDLLTPDELDAIADLTEPDAETDDEKTEEA